MPPKAVGGDIRSFFGGKTSTPIREKENIKAEDSKKKRSSKATIRLFFFRWRKLIVL